MPDNGPSSDPERSNVVLITAHDLGQHLGCYGVETVDTPNLDALAERGVRFENACTTTPVCSPSRGSLLTGRYPQSNGLMGLTHSPWWWRLDDREVTLPELLGEAGYETHLSGLQHVAPDASRLGFDHRHSEERDAEETAAAAEEIFRRADEGPVYAQFGFFEVHRPLDRDPHDEAGVYVPPHIEETEEMREDFARYQAEVNYLDERVGDILDALEASGYREDTIVVFAVDHGIPFPGAKWWCRSDGVEVATIVDGPGPAFEADGPEEALLSNVDVVPTILDALDLPVPDAVEGTSFRPYLAGETGDPPREAAFTQFQGSSSRGIITEGYNLIRNFDAAREVEYPVEAPPSSRGPSDLSDPLPYAQLYDREADPHELTDVAGEREAVVADLSDRLLGWMLDVDDPILRGPVATPYYDRAMADLLAGGDERDRSG